MKGRKIVYFSIGPIGAGLLGLITLPFVAWFFTVEDVGRLTMLQVVLSLSITVFSLDMHQSYVREYHEEKNKGGLLKATVIPGFVVLTVVLILLYMIPGSISLLLFGIESKWLTLFLLVAVFLTSIINFLAHVLRMQERALAFSATQIMPRLSLLIFIGLILLLNQENSFNNLMLVNTLAIFCSALLFIWITRDSCISAIYAPVNILLMTKMLYFSLPLVIGSFAYWGLTTMDRFFLRSLAGFEELGIYAMAVALAAAASVVSVVFSSLWHPIVYRWAKEGIEPQRVQVVTENIFLAVALIWTLAGVFSWLLLYILPKEYEAIKYLIVACIAMPLFYMLSEATVVGIGITRKSIYAMLASIIAFIVNAILNYLLIPSYGASGAALATMIAFFVFFIIRTEASSYLWKSLPRAKIYLLSVAYIITTIVMVLTEASQKFYFIIWILLFITTLLLFFRRSKESFLYLKGRV